MALVILRGNLSKDKKLKEAIPGGYPKSDACHADLNLVILCLFVSWNYLLSLIVAEGATSETYNKFCW